MLQKNNKKKIWKTLIFIFFKDIISKNLNKSNYFNILINLSIYLFKSLFTSISKSIILIY